MHTIEQYHPRQFHYCPTDDCSHGSPDDRSLCKLAGWTPLLCTCSIPQVWYTNCSSGWNLKNRSPKQKKGGHDDELSPFFGRLLTLDWRGLRTWRILHVESNGVQLPSLKYFAHRYCPYGRVFFLIGLQIPHLGSEEPLPTHFHIYPFISLHFMIFIPLPPLII